MANQLHTVESVVVLMLENRSFDNLIGFLYTSNGNKSPSGDSYDGLTGNETNPSHPNGTDPVRVSRNTTSPTVPTPDPHEEFEFITEQLFTPPGTRNQGFVIDYATVRGATGADIMRCYDPSMIPCLKSIAENYAVCDAWFASVPSQTWPNRSFVHCGWSNGHVNNAPDDPLRWDIETIYNEMTSTRKASWSVYYDEFFISLTRLQLPKLWKLRYSRNFKPFKEFLKDANAGRLPNYAFVEPNFFHNPITGEQANDQHPPHDVVFGDTFIGHVYNAVVTSPQWKANQVLFIITHDEHGGCYDHVPPPLDAKPPQPGTGDFGFDFKRFGVRVPFVLVSPYVPKGSVFRAPAGQTFDHTSILATLEQRYGLGALKDRETVAPDLGDVLSLPQPRTDSAPIVLPPQEAAFAAAPGDVANAPLNDLQRSIIRAVHHAAIQMPALVPEIAATVAGAATMEPPELVQTIDQAHAYIQNARKHLRI